MLVFLASVLVVLSIWQFKISNAQALESLDGWGWSSNTGWISLSNSTPGSGGGAPGGYGVKIDSLGNLSGYAWSSNIGWLSFNADDVANCPDSRGCAPKVNLRSREVSGWAKFCSGTSGGDCKGQGRLDGWSGWVSLRDDKFGLTLGDTVPHQLNGWAWGGEVVGWIRFQNFVTSVEIPLQATCAPSQGVVPKGNTVTWAVTVVGGQTPFTYAWSGDGGLTGSKESITKIYNTVGVKNATVVVGSGGGLLSVTADCKVTIGEPGKVLIHEIPPRSR